jgi:hypothetical protein
MMRMFIAYTLAVALVGTMGAQASQQNAKAETVDVCRLQANPAAYNRKLIEVSGLVLHGFEQFSMSDSQCLQKLGIWLEYGGSVNSETVFCCGPRAGTPRGRTLIVEGMTLPLVDDALFRRFDDRIRKSLKATEVKFPAKLPGHFFAGTKQQAADGREYWGGYGHLGCCSMLVIQQVLAVDDNLSPSPSDSRK